MDAEHLIGLGIVLVLAAIAAWFVWVCLCKGESDEEDVESQQGDDEVKSVNSRTKVITRQALERYEDEENCQQPKVDKDAPLKEVFIKGKTKNKSSCYVQSHSTGLADPFGEWTRKEKVTDDTEALSGVRVYRKSPVLPHRR